MKIGIVTTWFERGGAYVSRQYQQALDRKHDVFIYARGGENYGMNESGWAHDQVFWSPKVLGSVATRLDLNVFRRWVKHHDLDWVIFNEQKDFLPVLLCQEMGVFTAAYIDYYTEDTVPLFANYDILLCNTKRHYSVFQWHKGARYIPWGTDTQQFKLAREGLVHPGRVTFFHSAGMSPYRKGTDSVLRAFETVEGNSHLIIHSQVDLMNVLPREKECIRKLLCGKRLEIVEETIQAPGLYHRGDVYIYPSRLDGIGLTVAEALACGLPCIVPDNGPMNEFITTEVMGQTVDIEKYIARPDGYYWPQCQVDLESLVKAMERYVKASEKLANIKIQVSELARQNLDWRKNSAGVADMFMQDPKPLNDMRLQARVAAAKYDKSRMKFYDYFPRWAYLINQVRKAGLRFLKNQGRDE